MPRHRIRGNAAGDGRNGRRFAQQREPVGEGKYGPIARYRDRGRERFVGVGLWSADIRSGPGLAQFQLLSYKAADWIGALDGYVTSTLRRTDPTSRTPPGMVIGEA